MDNRWVQGLINQIQETWIIPEAERRNFSESIFAALVVFEVGATKVLLNGETRFRVKIDPAVGGELNTGAVVTLDELKKHKILSIKIPDAIYDNYPFIACVIVGDQWTIRFNTIPNKIEGRDKLLLAKDFIRVAKAAETEKVKLYNVFQAIEQAAHAALLGNPSTIENVRKAKKHEAIKSTLNSQANLGNIPDEIAQLFNNLLQNRKKLYSQEEVGVTLTLKDFSLIEGYIESLWRNVVQ